MVLSGDVYKVGMFVLIKYALLHFNLAIKLNCVSLFTVGHVQGYDEN